MSRMLDYCFPMYKVFQIPIDHTKLSDSEFWHRVDQIEELSDRFEQGMGAFALSIKTGSSELDIPYVRFSPMYPSRAS